MSPSSVSDAPWAVIEPVGPAPDPAAAAGLPRQCRLYRDGTPYLIAYGTTIAQLPSWRATLLTGATPGAAIAPSQPSWRR